LMLCPMRRTRDSAHGVRIDHRASNAGLHRAPRGFLLAVRPGESALGIMIACPFAC
jgi:hypothetical protein